MRTIAPIAQIKIRYLLQEQLEVVAVQHKQVACGDRPDRCVPPLTREQRNLAEKRAVRQCADPLCGSMYFSTTYHTWLRMLHRMKLQFVSHSILSDKAPKPGILLSPCPTQIYPQGWSGGGCASPASWPGEREATISIDPRDSTYISNPTSPCRTRTSSRAHTDGLSRRAIATCPRASHMRAHFRAEAAARHSILALDAAGCVLCIRAA